MRKLLLLGLLAVAACSQAPTQTAREAVAASAAVYSAGFTAFKVYAGLPRCATNPAPCSDPQKIVTIGNSLVLARGAVELAQGVVNTLPETVTVAALPADKQKIITDAAAAATAANTAATGAK